MKGSKVKGTNMAVPWLQMIDRIIELDGCELPTAAYYLEPIHKEHVNVDYGYADNGDGDASV